MAITKKSGRQELINAWVNFTYADFPALFGTATPSASQAAIEIPYGSVIQSGRLIIDTPFATVGVFATGTLTQSSTYTISDGETVTINGTVFTFKTALTPLVGEVLIDATGTSLETNSFANLAAAINGGAGAGIKYVAPAAPVSGIVTATSGVHTLTLTAKVSGTAANSYTTTETLAFGAWGGGTLSGGLAGADKLAVVLAAGTESYLTATAVDTAGHTNLVPTGTVVSQDTTLGLVHSVAATSTATATAGAGRLYVEYIRTNREEFSQGV